MEPSKRSKFKIVHPLAYARDTDLTFWDVAEPLNPRNLKAKSKFDVRKLVPNYAPVVSIDSYDFKAIDKKYAEMIHK
jgi:hypothetical protein